MRLLSLTGAGALLLAWRVFVGAASAAEKAEAVYESPSGAFRIVEGSEDVPRQYVVATKNPQRRVALPRAADSETTEDEFHASPDDHFLFALHHVGSGLRDGTLYELSSPTEIVVPKKAASFSSRAWQAAKRLGATKRDFSEEGLYAMTFFVAWSEDSTRLLVKLGGGEEKRSFQYCYVYFNTRTQAFELTDYLRRLAKAAGSVLACAEEQTPNVPDAKGQADAADAELNKVYRQRMAKADKTAAGVLRDEQRNWIKERDAGLPIYVGAFPAAEKEGRRLQYLAAVTFARIDSLKWEQR